MRKLCDQNVIDPIFNQEIITVTVLNPNPTLTSVLPDSEPA